MPNPRDLAPQEPGPPNVARAVIERAPASLADTLRVSVPSKIEDPTEPARVEEIRFWMPRGAVLPSAGDVALVAFDETGEPWLIAFSPAS
jgi:hypothetical protein